jgi:preprotein translocase subunit SecE
MNPAGWYRDTREYFAEVNVEFKKITWPPQQESIAGTVGVIVVVAIITVVLGVVDFGLSELMGLMLR